MRITSDRCSPSGDERRVRKDRFPFPDHEKGQPVDLRARGKSRILSPQIAAILNPSHRTGIVTRAHARRGLLKQSIEVSNMTFNLDHSAVILAEK